MKAKKVTTPAQVEHLKQFAFQPGQSGNPKGREKGSRNKLGEEFIAALHDDFLQHGRETIERVREVNPVAYVKIVASLLPRELHIDRASDLSDEELVAKIRLLNQQLEQAGIDLWHEEEGGAGPEEPLH